MLATSNMRSNKVLSERSEVLILDSKSCPSALGTQGVRALVSSIITCRGWRRSWLAAAKNSLFCRSAPSARALASVTWLISWRSCSTSAAFSWRSRAPSRRRLLMPDEMNMQVIIDSSNTTAR